MKKGFAKGISIQDAAMRGDHHRILLRLNFSIGLPAMYHGTIEGYYKQAFFDEIRVSGDTWSTHPIQNSEELANVVTSMKESCVNRLYIQSNNRIWRLLDCVVPSTQLARAKLYKKLCRRGHVDSQHSIGQFHPDYAFYDRPAIGLLNAAQISENSRTTQQFCATASELTAPLIDRIHLPKGSNLSRSVIPPGTVFFIATPFICFPDSQRRLQQFWTDPVALNKEGQHEIIYMVMDPEALASQETGEKFEAHILRSQNLHESPSEVSLSSGGHTPPRLAAE